MKLTLILFKKLSIFSDGSLLLELNVSNVEKKSVIIKLFDGWTLSWDGRKVYHCTATNEVGDGNHVYGNYWGGKQYR